MFYKSFNTSASFRRLVFSVAVFQKFYSIPIPIPPQKFYLIPIPIPAILLDFDSDSNSIC